MTVLYWFLVAGCGCEAVVEALADDGWRTFGMTTAVVLLLLVRQELTRKGE